MPPRRVPKPPAPVPLQHAAACRRPHRAPFQRLHASSPRPCAAGDPPVDASAGRWRAGARGWGCPADPRRGRPVFLLLPSHGWFSNKPPVFLACAHHTHTPLPTSGFARAHTSAAANIHAVGFFIQVACALFFLPRVAFTLSSTKFRSHLVWHIFYRLMLSVVYLGT